MPILKKEIIKKFLKKRLPLIIAGIVFIALGTYFAISRSSALTTPPDWVWVEQLGDSAADDRGKAVAKDDFGNVYVAGDFDGDTGSGIDFATLGGNCAANIVGVAGNGTDIYLAKFDSDGVCIWLTTFSGTDNDSVNDIFVNSALPSTTGDIYLTGSFNDNPTFGGLTLTDVTPGGDDMYAVKLNFNESLLPGDPVTGVWGVQLDSNGSGSPNPGTALAFDSSVNKVYVTGYFNDAADFYDSGGIEFTLSGAGDNDIFFVRVDDGTGLFDFGKSAGGNLSDHGVGVDVFGSDVYLSGIFRGNTTFDPGGDEQTIASFGVSDSFLAKYDTAGNLIWARPMGGIGDIDGASDVSADSAGDNIYVAGFVSGDATFPRHNFIATWGSFGLGDGEFDLPKRLAINESLGRTYVTDSVNNRVQVFLLNDNSFLFEWGTAGTGQGEFDSPGGITIDPDNGNVYVADVVNNRVQKFDQDGNFILMWGRDVVDEGPSVDNGFEICTSTDTCQIGVVGISDGEFENPFSLAIDSSNNIYTTENNNNRVQKFNDDGTGTNTSISFIQMWGKDVDTGGDEDTNGLDICTPAETCQAGTPDSGDGVFDLPSGLAVDSSDNFYVADFNNNRVLLFDSSGNFSFTFGFGVSDGSGVLQTCVGPGCQAGIAGTSAGQFDGPADIAIDSLGNIYVTEFGNQRVQKFVIGLGGAEFLIMWGGDVKGLGLTNFEICAAAESCSSGSADTGNGEFDTPSGIAIDSSNNIYVTDSSNNRVQKFNTTDNLDLTAVSTLDIFVTKIDSTTGDFVWARRAGNEHDVANSFFPKLTLDDDDNVYVAGNFSGTATFDNTTDFIALSIARLHDILVFGYDPNGDFLWAQSAGGVAESAAPSVTTPDSGGDVGQFNAVTLDSFGFPVVAYRDFTNGDLKVLHCNDVDCAGGDESIESVDTVGSVGIDPSIVLDSSGFPVVSYQDFTNTNLKVLHCNDANCDGGDESIESVDTAGSVGLRSSLSLDSLGFPVVAYSDETNLNLKILHCNDVNCAGLDESITSPDTGGNVGASPSLSLDSFDFPVVSYRDNTNTNLKIIHCNDINCDGVGESITAPDTSGNAVGVGSSLELDGSGFPVVSYSDETNSDLKILHCNDINCDGGDESITIPDTVGNVGLGSSLELDSSGFPLVSYLDLSNGSTNILHCNDVNCDGGDESINDTVTSGASHDSLVLDSSGFPVVSFYTGDLNILHCIDSDCSSFVVDGEDFATDIVSGGSWYVVIKAFLHLALLILVVRALMMAFWPNLILPCLLHLLLLRLHLLQPAEAAAQVLP